MKTMVKCMYIVYIDSNGVIVCVGLSPLSHVITIIVETMYSLFILVDLCNHFITHKIHFMFKSQFSQNNTDKYYMRGIAV